MSDAEDEEIEPEETEEEQTVAHCPVSTAHIRGSGIACVLTRTFPVSSPLDTHTNPLFRPSLAPNST
jgi:hypothetical protein